MATKKDIKKFLKETGYTSEQMENFYTELALTNRIGKTLKASEKTNTWDKLNMTLIRELPTYKQKFIEHEKAKAAEKLQVEIERKQQQEKAKYYAEHFFELMIDKIDKKEELSERELRDFAEYEAEQEEGDAGRWSKTICSYVKDELSSRWFCVQWEQGLTEYQENEYHNQPYEVVREEKEITKTIVIFKAKEGENNE